VRELCTNYGKIDLFWWDAIWFGGMFTAEMWDGEKITRLIRELQPGIVMNNRCCVPGDFDTPEGRLGAFQNWRPWESCICLTNSWSYSATPPKELKHLVKMITNNVCGDGNLLLSWGPHWDGAFDATEKARLLEFGQWVKAHERTLFNTRGGPWKCSSWGGAVYRDSTAFLHITNLPGGILDLPELPGRTVLSASLLNGTTVEMKEKDAYIQLMIPEAIMDDLDTIVQVEFDRPLEGIEAIATGHQTIFSDFTTYGSKIETDVTVTAGSCVHGEGELDTLLAEVVEFRLATRNEEKPWVLLDLQEEKIVTGLRVEYYANRQRRMTVHAFASPDGEDWTDCGEIQQPFGELPINAIKSGASIPGLPARYIKIAVVSDNPAILELRHCALFVRG